MNSPHFGKKSLRQKIANACFLMLFPGFFFYHFAIARGFIPPILGGYFGVVALFVFYPLFYSHIKLKYSTFNGKVYHTFLVIIFYTFTVINVNYIFDRPHGFSFDLYFWSMSSLFFNIITFLIGAHANIRKMIKINVVFLILMLLLVVFNVGENGIFYVKDEAVDGSNVATYQGFGRSFVFVSLIITGIYIGKANKLFFIFCVSVVALLLNGARTEFVSYIISTFIVFLLYRYQSFKSLFSLFLAIVVLFYFGFHLADMYPESRMLQLFNLQESSSYEARKNLNENGLNIIHDNILLGGYGMYAALDGIGSYPHNLLSAWVNLGLIGFSLYILLFIYLIMEAFYCFKEKSNELKYRVFLIFLVFTIISVIFSKDYTYMAISFLIGLYVNLKFEVK
jgi:hypothetical protein